MTRPLALSLLLLAACTKAPEAPAPAASGGPVEQERKLIAQRETLVEAFSGGPAAACEKVLSALMPRRTAPRSRSRASTLTRSVSSGVQMLPQSKQ